MFGFLFHFKCEEFHSSKKYTDVLLQVNSDNDFGIYSGLQLCEVIFQCKNKFMVSIFHHLKFSFIILSSVISINSRSKHTLNVSCKLVFEFLKFL